ncbi:MAG TPA: Glu-tRNA(Gln) amidotransferase subunit GatE [Methanomicrobiales archaeon]|nr:Glu-tRNA(Gln) amidotransferase subunit GatE [Methanomicrobiales archaeon]
MASETPGLRAGLAGRPPAALPRPPLRAGLEIHQQLDTGEKLFCRCPACLRDTKEHTGEFTRFLRATESEMGEIDRAALEEMRTVRRFTYYTYDTTCLVEDDEEPPQSLNPEALASCLTIAKCFGMHPVGQVHTMRKIVIDGSNTCGFQRTALVALGGTLPGGCRVETICLEEDAAQRVTDQVFSLDRLGIPLVEITTGPDLRSPEEVEEVAGYIGMVLRSTGKVKRGKGTIRQDINISIPDGARVEIKGVQELGLIAEVVRREVQRQENLLAIRHALRERGARVDGEPLEVTDLFRGTKSSILSKAKVILAVRLRGFAGLMGKEIQPGRRLGSELSDYAKRCRVGGIFHTDELPAYGITAGEVRSLREQVNAEEGDAVALVAGTPEEAGCAARQVIRRAEMALEGVPEETRRMLEEGSTAYMRPLPGAARMYPETDIFPVTVDRETWEGIPVPELLTVKAGRFTRELGLDPAAAYQAAFSENLPVFEMAVREGVKPTLAYRAIISAPTELFRKGIGMERVRPADYLALLRAVEAGRVAKEAIPEILGATASGVPAEEAITALGSTVTGDELTRIIRRVLKERRDFVAEKRMAALGPLMGVVMQEVRGKVDGKAVSEALRRELERFLREKPRE